MRQMSETMTINVDSNVAAEFRKRAEVRYGKKKGHLAKAVTEALSQWNKTNDTDLEEEFRKLLKEGIKMKKWKFNRDELHER